MVLAYFIAINMHALSAGGIEEQAIGRVPLEIKHAGQ